VRVGRRAVVAAAGAAVPGLAAAGAARCAYSVLKRRPPGGEKAWRRTNHRGKAVTLLEGPAAVAGAIAGVLAEVGLRSVTGPARGRAAWRAAAAMIVAGAGAAAFGAYDDLAGSSDRRGFRGHLGALRHGEVTTGAVKLGGIGVTGAASAALFGGNAADLVINSGLVAGFANLLNLFDLRPGRAIKVAVASGVLIAGSRGRGGRDTAGAGGTAAALLPPLAAALALLPEDLGERAMLGDAGANAVGGMLGAAACGLSRPARLVLLAGIAGLTAASEKISFTAVIERTPVLHRLDMLGRRPASPAPVINIPAQRAVGQHHGGQHDAGRRQDTMGPAGDPGTGRRAESTDVAPPQE
jgi:UDP-GlcNAc:undecaprenyl-phosphate/decaprenyl-phosphate GlcNAc-1-phosphate transferase